MTEDIKHLKRQCVTNTEICDHFGIAETTLYDWLDEASPRFNSEFSEAYSKGLDASKKTLKDLALSSVANSIKGVVTKQIELDSDGKVIKTIIKEEKPNATLAFKLLQTLDHRNFPADPSTIPHLPMRQINIQITPEQKKRFDEEFEELL